MNPNLVLLLLVAALYACGIYLLLERSLTRVLLGIIVLGNATNILILTSGGDAGNVPIVGLSKPEEMSDPLAQAMILTAIVIGAGVSAFILAMIHRLWEFDNSDDDVDDDAEDVRIAKLVNQRQEQHVDTELPNPAGDA